MGLSHGLPHAALGDRHSSSPQNNRLISPYSNERLFRGPHKKSIVITN